MEKNNNKVIWWVVGAIVVLAIGGVAAYALMNLKKQSTSPETTGSDTSSQTDNDKASAGTDGDTPTASEQATGVTIVFTNEGFEKSSYTVKRGQSVKVENKSNTQLQFSSDDHPTHTEDPELNLEVLQPGQSASITPTKVGEHEFHDHLQSQFTGTLTVTE